MVVPLTRRFVFTNVASLMISSVLTQAFTALAVFLTARALGAENYGAYVSCFALTKLTSIAFNLGLDTWLLREAGYEQSRIGELVSTVLGTKLRFGLLWVASIVSIGFLLNSGNYPPLLLAFSAVTTWLESLVNTFVCGYKSILKIKTSALVITISGLLLLLITSGLILAKENRVSAFLGARLVVALMMVLLLARLSRRSFVIGNNGIHLRKLFSELWPYLGSESLFLVYTYADITIVGLLISPMAAGLYGPATSILSTIYIIPQSVVSFLIPVFSRLFAANDQRLNKAILRALSLSALLGLSLTAATSIFGPTLTTLLLGPDYTASGELLKILSINITFKSISLACISVLTAIGWNRTRLFAQLLSAIINVLLNLLIIRTFGLRGVAWVYVISECILMLGYLWLIPRARVFIRAAKQSV